ncbi:MAG: NAD(P)-dependent oxidoreductase [Alphaproteobacteria bacterium]
MKTVAWIGLGNMGYPMAGHLRQSGGCDVVVHNRSPEKAARWVNEFDGRMAHSQLEAARRAEVVFISAGNDDDLRAIVFGEEGVLQGLDEGAIIVDHTTTSAVVAIEIQALAKKHGIDFVDAPVSGGEAGAKQGSLAVMAGGTSESFSRAEPFMKAYSSQVRHVGPPGAGQLVKMVNQICTVGIIQSLAEGLHFARQAGLDIPVAMGALGNGAARSWQMENRWETMMNDLFDFGFAVDWIRKDLSICLDEARRNGANLPTTALIDQFYADLQAMGGNNWDSSSLIRRLNTSQLAEET